MRPLILATTLVTLAGCALPTVDREAAGFDEARYASDLSTCRGGSAASFALKSFGGAVIGAAIGAAEGASTGAISGDAEEGAWIGAIVGGVLGIGVGAYQSLADQSDNVEGCLRQKGYRVQSI